VGNLMDSKECGVDAKPVNVEMPDALRNFVDERVRNGDYADAGEYLRDLVRRDREQQAATRLSELIEEGLASGPPREMNDSDWADLRALAIRVRA
jgi:antitoxin ParD1/3/4